MELNKKDWMTLRLLYLILASDPSAAVLPDVAKVIDHYGYHKMLWAFELLNKEIANDGRTFGHPEVNMTRYVAVNSRKNHGADT